MPKIIVVVGATGTQGGSVARTFSKIPGWEVRGITRNPESSAARKLEENGIKLVKADLNDVESLEAAFKSANVIFGVTDFWQFVKSPSTQELVKSQGITWNVACYLQEVQQGKNIIDAASRVVGQGQLERMVYSSLSDAKKASKGKYSWVYHFDGKAHVVQYLESKSQDDDQYRLLFNKTSYVQMGNYLDNWNKNPIFNPKKDSDGKVVFRYICADTPAQARTKPTPFVHPPTDTGPFVEALVLRAPPQTTILGTSSPMDFLDYVKLWGAINNVETIAQPLTLKEIENMWPGGFGREVGETACYTREFGWDGGEGAILPEKVGVDKSSLTDVTTYIKTTDWSSVLI